MTRFPIVSVFDGFDESIRNMSGEAVAYRILLELAKVGIVRCGDRIFRHTSGEAEVAIPAPLSNTRGESDRAASGEKTAVHVKFRGKTLHVNFLHPMKVAETKILARHEALLNDVHSVSSKGEMSKEDFCSLLKSKGILHRCKFRASEEMRRAVQKYIAAVVRDGSDVSSGQKVVQAILAQTSMGSDPKVRKKVARLIQYFKDTKLEEVDGGGYRYKDDEGTVMSAMNMSLIEIDIEQVILGLAKEDDESVSSIEDDTGSIDTNCCSIYSSKPASAASAAEEDDRKPAAKRTADEAFAGDTNEFVGEIAEI